ncbi:hypothetical protein [Chitinimonas koreensis]|uniref:hypothetical protein n=1 Tax=Chitinimonas koreensis TaxID=356302 RepID=UPI0012F83D55|nr:hypothetical protein [Chitinimonas koreensis]QNM95443.1 hypothetical protein H9L41_16440 [Chitinimonas koreensis]
MTYTLSRADLASVSQLEEAFGTDRLLPAWENIPEDFRSGRNVYKDILEALFFGHSMPPGRLKFLLGFDDDAAPSDLNTCVRAHLKSWAPKHEHKMAGIAYMMSLVCAFHSDPHDGIGPMTYPTNPATRPR